MSKFPALPRIFLLIFICITAFIISTFFPQKSEKIIYLHEDQIELQQLNNAILTYILEEGYGYRVEMVEGTVKELKKLFENGDMDITLELWKDNNLVWHDQSIEKGYIQNLGTIYVGGKQYWIVSEWYARQNDIETVFDMARHWQDFADPEDPSKGLFLNCIVGWFCRDINSLKLKIYGLDRHFNTVSPVSPESLRSIYENSQLKRLPLFGYYWEPNAIMINQDWHILKEPAYDEKVWNELMQWLEDPEKTIPEKACAYNEAGAYKIIHSGLEKKAPEVVELLRKMEMDYQIFNTILFNAGSPGASGADFRTAAIYFLNTYQDVWVKWVSDDVRRNIETALKGRSFDRSKEG